MSFIELPLHTGHCPRWLFKRMVKLSELILNVMIEEYGVKTLIDRLSNPLWFQCFSTLIGFRLG